MFPTTFDDLKRFSISELMKSGYLRENAVSAWRYTWKRWDFKVDLSTNLTGEPKDHCLTIQHPQNDKVVKYRVKLVSIPANVGNGKRWFFLCPFTGKRCSKLYLYRGYFRSRGSLKWIHYEKQNYSKYNRLLINALEFIFEDNPNGKGVPENFRYHYNGKPTKNYLKSKRHSAGIEWAADFLNECV